MQIMKVQPWGKDQGDHVLLNVSDFDPAKHVPYDAAEAAKVADKLPADDEGAKKADSGSVKPAGKPSDGLTVVELKAALEAKKVPIPDGAKKADLQALLDAAP